MSEIKMSCISAPPSASEILKGKVWWTSVWPLFAVSVVVSVIAREAFGLKGGFVGVGGLGAVIVGSYLAGAFVKTPVFTFGGAFGKGAWSIGAFFLLFGLVCSAPTTYREFEQQGMRNPGAAVAFGVFVEIVVTTLMLSATWAFFITRKAKRLMRAAGFSLVEDAPALPGCEAPAQPERAQPSDLGLVTSGVAPSSEVAATVSPSPELSPTTPAKPDVTKRSRMQVFLSTGWGRLFVVTWVLWAGWRFYAVNAAADDDYGSWQGEHVINFVLTGLLLPVVVSLAALWVARGFKRKGAMG